MKLLSFEPTKDQVKDATRLALQSALSAVITYTVMETFDIPEKFVGVLSAVLVVTPSIGNTFDQGKGRILSTLLGTAIGFLLVSVLPWGFGTAISLVICMLIINAIASFRPGWRYGVVAGVALCLASENELYETSIDRIISISLGVAIGFVISLIVWPDKAEKRALRYLRKALQNASDRFDIAIENTRDKDNKDASEFANDFHQNLGYAKSVANAIKFANKKKVLKQIDSTEKLYNSILIIHRVADQSYESVSDGEAGIEQNSEEVKEKAKAIIDSFATNDKIKKEDLNAFSELVKTTQSNVNMDSDNIEVNMLRSTFVFGLTEIEESIKNLYESFKE